MADNELILSIGSDFQQIFNDVSASCTLKVVSFSGGSIYGEPLASGNSYSINAIVQPLKHKFILSSAGKWQVGDMNAWFLSGGSVSPFAINPYTQSGGSLFFLQYASNWYELKEIEAPNIVGSQFFYDTKLKLCGSPL